jgi:Ca2+/Na+ antiporter
MSMESTQILNKLEQWEISPDVLKKLRHQLEIKDGVVHEGSGSESEEEHDHGPLWAAFENAVYPLEVLLAFTCPECEYGTPNEGWYLFTFLMSFVWVAIFSFLISSVVERWVKVSGMPMSFFGLLVVSVAAQTPDTLESLAVSKKGYGSMAIANCLGTQTINIGIGLALPWIFSSAGGVHIELESELLVPCWIMVFLLLTNLFVLYTDVIFRGAKKVILGRTKAYILCITYCISIIVYAIYLVNAGEL